MLRSAMSCPIKRHAFWSINDGNDNRKSLAFVVATDTTLLVTRCITLACTYLELMNTSRMKGLKNFSVRCFHDFLFFPEPGFPFDRRVHAASTTHDARDLEFSFTTGENNSCDEDNELDQLISGKVSLDCREQQLLAL